MSRTAALLPLIAACGGSELARLEVEQQALHREVEVLAQHVGAMRTEMQAIGMIPSGPAGATGPDPKSALAGLLTYQVERLGQIPTLPALPEPERRDSTECGWRFHTPWLTSLSDQLLEKSGSGKASPLVLLHDDLPLDPHATPPKYERSCEGAYRVQPKYVFFSPDGPDAVDGTWALSLDDRIPAPRGGDGHGMYWVYPGTTLTFTFATGWDAAWGAFDIEFDARLLPIGVPERPNEVPAGEARVSTLGEEVSASTNRLGMSISPPLPDGAWTLDVSSPSDGPYVLIGSLVLGNEDQALVVVGSSQ